MQKKYHDSWDYVLKVTYGSDEELEKTVYEIINEADSLADLRDCFIEIDVTHKESDKHW